MNYIIVLFVWKHQDLLFPSCWLPLFLVEFMGSIPQLDLWPWCTGWDYVQLQLFTLKRTQRLLCCAQRARRPLTSQHAWGFVFVFLLSIFKYKQRWKWWCEILSQCIKRSNFLLEKTRNNSKSVLLKRLLETLWQRYPIVYYYTSNKAFVLFNK